MQIMECSKYGHVVKITHEFKKGGLRDKNLTKRMYIWCYVYKNFMTTETLLFLMSLIVDNFPLKSQAKLVFFHRRLCHKVEM